MRTLDGDVRPVTGASSASVTFVGHDASLTGAPRVLLSLLEWLPPELRGGTDLVLVRGGPLVVEYGAVVPTRVLGVFGRTSASARHVVPNRSVSRRGTGSIIVASTLAALPVASCLARRGQLVCHVHELDGVAARVLPAGTRRDRAVGAVDRFVAAGDAVGAMLIDRWRIDRRRVDIVDEFVAPRVTDRLAGERLRSKLGVEAGRPIVLAVGAVGARKGADHFVELMGALRTHPSNPVGVWLGGEPGSPAHVQFGLDVGAAGLADHVRFVADVSDSGPFYDLATIVVSTAREDPFPLNVLEAGRDGVPVVAFAAGGAADALASAGLGDHVVAVGDVLTMRDRVAGLLDDTTAATAAGVALQSWVRSTHLAEHLAPLLWDALTRAGER